jgi:phosphoribosylformylglycinamidine synthase
VSRQVTLKVEQPRTPWTSGLAPGTLLRMPVAHHDGAYIADRKTLDELEDQGQVLLRYAPAGGDDGRFNPNGAENAIAGISSRAGNVFGLMPHPERAMEEGLESADGRTFLAAMLAAMEARS